MTVLTQILNGSAGADVRETLNAWSKGRMPEILIAGFNAPAYVKSRADYICTGTDDNVLIQSVIDGLPTLPDFIRSAVIVTGARYGNIRFVGQFKISTALNFPQGIYVLTGNGPGSWRPIDPVDDVYAGGTQFYSTDPTGKIMAFPQFTGVRGLDPNMGQTNTIPVTGLDMEGFDLRVKNPTATSSASALDLSGITTGDVRRINVLCDTRDPVTGQLDTTEYRIGTGVNWTAGARSDRKHLRSIASFYWRNSAYNIGTTHIHGEHLAGGKVQNGTSPCVFQIASDQNNSWHKLHAFSCATGVKLTNGQPIDIDNIMFESVEVPVVCSGAAALAVRNNRIRQLGMNSDMTTKYTGDILNFQIENLYDYTNPALRVRNRVQVTVAAGATSGSAPHSLKLTPTSAIPSAKSSIGAGNWAWTTYDATNVTVNLGAAAPAGGVTFDVDVRWA